MIPQAKSVGTSPSSSGPLKQYRAQFFRDDKIHLNNAGLAPISQNSMREMQDWSRRFYEEGFFCDADYMARVAWSRGRLAELVGCGPGEIAYFQSVSGAVSQFAFHFGLRSGDEVITWDQEYGSHLYPWREACRRSGAHLIAVPSGPEMSTPVDLLLAKITPRTRLIAVSWVQFQTGSVTDLEALAKVCREKGVELFVDAIQGLGLRSMDFKGLGLAGLAGGSHKWLQGPVGVGFLVIREDLARVMEPLMIGASTYGTCDDPTLLVCEPKTDALRFESGSKQVLEIVGLGVAVDLVLETGVDILFAESCRLANFLRRSLVERGFSSHSPQHGEDSPWVNLTHPKVSPAELKEILFRHRITSALRGPGLRLTPAAFNTDAEMESAVRILARAISNA